MTLGSTKTRKTWFWNILKSQEFSCVFYDEISWNMKRMCWNVLRELRCEIQFQAIDLWWSGIGNWLSYGIRWVEVESFVKSIVFVALMNFLIIFSIFCFAKVCKYFLKYCHGNLKQWCWCLSHIFRTIPQFLAVM